MKKINILFFLLLFAIGLQAQEGRYVEEVFSDVNVQTNVTYGVNATVLAFTDVGEAIPQELLMDVYQPEGDTETERPVVLVFHTGNFLPFPENLGTGGTKEDSTVVEVCNRLAKMGYVAASVDYRLGWNPIAPTQDERVFTLINAAYRGVQDARTAIRFFKKTVAEEGNPYAVDTTRVTLWGIGTGGYVSLNTLGLDAYEKVLLPKFTTQDPAGNPIPMVIEQINGDIEGKTVGQATGDFPPGFPAGDTLCYPNHVEYGSEFQLAVNMGGALGDSSWIDPGQPPVISYQVPTDPFAPYNCGVLTVPGVGLAVVEVCGASVVQAQQEAFGNNDAWEAADFVDPITQLANSRNDGRNGLLPLPTDDVTDSSPWDFYAEDNVNAEEPPNPERARMYMDTIMAYFAPRACVTLGLECDLTNVSSTENVLSANDVQLQMMPNPAYDRVTLQSGVDHPIQDVQVFDMSGRLVKSDLNVQNNFITLHRDGLANGVYIVKLRFEEGVVTQKLIFN
jgi:hypothetical protein